MPDYLRRAEAGFPAPVWDLLDRVVVELAQGQLIGRRILPLDGPHGIGLKVVTRRAEELCGPASGTGEGAACLSVGGGLPVPLLYQEFTLGVRDVEAHLAFGQPLDLSPAIRAVKAVIAREEELVFRGERRAGLVGLTTTPGVAEIEIGDWARGERAIEDLIGAVTLLDGREPRSRTALSLAPDLYNALFHKYEESDLLRIDHLRSLIPEGIHKTPTLEPRTGVLVVANPAVARLVVGADLALGYRALDGMFHRFVVFESLVAEVLRPEGICVLRGDRPGGVGEDAPAGA